MVKPPGSVELSSVVSIVAIVPLYFLRLRLGIVVTSLVLLYNHNGYVDLSKEHGLSSCGLLDFKHGRESNLVPDLRPVPCPFVKLFVTFVLFLRIYEAHLCFPPGIPMIAEHRPSGLRVVYSFSINTTLLILSFLSKLNPVV